MMDIHNFPNTTIAVCYNLRAAVESLRCKNVDIHKVKIIVKYKTFINANRESNELINEQEFAEITDP